MPQVSEFSWLILSLKFLIILYTFMVLLNFNLFKMTFFEKFFIKKFNYNLFM